LHKPIPAFHYMVAKAGGDDIPLAPYATYGTPELAAHVCASLKERNACLLANHGQVAIGEALQGALELAEEVEALAAQYVAALSVGQPVLLSAQEMRRVALKFKDYGKQPKEKAAAKKAR
jgi:L-fuculose-phosphate aldolase